MTEDRETVRGRAFAYRFLELPTHVQHRLLKEIGFEINLGAFDIDEYIRAVKWARENGKLEELQGKVAALASTADRQVAPNAINRALKAIEDKIAEYLSSGSILDQHARHQRISGLHDAKNILTPLLAADRQVAVHDAHYKARKRIADAATAAGIAITSEFGQEIDAALTELRGAALARARQGEGLDRPIDATTELGACDTLVGLRKPDDKRTTFERLAEEISRLRDELARGADEVRRLREAQVRLEEAKEWDTTAYYHISRWPELEWRKKRLAELEAAASSAAPTEESKS